jgi:hypothetical protein
MPTPASLRRRRLLHLLLLLLLMLPPPRHPISSYCAAMQANLQHPLYSPAQPFSQNATSKALTADHLAAARRRTCTLSPSMLIFTPDVLRSSSVAGGAPFLYRF